MQIPRQVPVWPLLLCYQEAASMPNMLLQFSSGTHRGRLASARTALILIIADVLDKAADRPLYTSAPVSTAGTAPQIGGISADPNTSALGITGQQAAIDNTMSGFM